MRHIHPFPARMAPDIALSRIGMLDKNDVVLDPMCGSGMVLSQASRVGLKSIGFDLDPLAKTISQTSATRFSELMVREGLEKLLEKVYESSGSPRMRYIPWIDSDKETSAFVKFWFGPKQERQLRELSHHLVVEPVISDETTLSILKIIVSRLIITKEPKASFARDTAHSRPHRTIVENEFDIFSSLQKSLEHVLSALSFQEIQRDATVHLGDARNMKPIRSSTIDAIITSPPYLNAIDYMRGHRLSLIWWGHNLNELRAIRSKTIGAERSLKTESTDAYRKIVDRMNFDELEPKTQSMLWRYFRDLSNQTSESYRVLKKGRSATYVIGNSNIRGKYIPNNVLLKEAAISIGFKIKSESIREIPNNRRYLPITDKGGSSILGRMRHEHIIELVKC